MKPMLAPEGGLLWTAFGNEDGDVMQDMAYGWIKRLCDQKGAAFSCYRNKFIAGIGDGASIVQNLPKDEWNKSWLSRSVHVGR